jgi:hypothetical protein
MSDNTLVDAEMSLVNGVEGLAPAGVNVLLNNPITDTFERHLLGYVNSFAGKSATDLLQHLGSTVGALEAKLPDFAKPLAKELRGPHPGRPLARRGHAEHAGRHRSVRGRPPHGRAGREAVEALGGGAERADRRVVVPETRTPPSQ